MLWNDPDAAWWAKAARARKHLAGLDVMMTEFRPETAYEIEREPAEQPGTAVLRLRVRRKVPAEILTTVGDVLHNMRSCLDSVAFELGRRHIGEEITEKQERAAGFPVCETAQKFEEFLSHPDRQGLYGDAERKALRCVQPFAIPEEALGAGATISATPGEDFRIDQLARLTRLNNLDKHRYLPLLAWQHDWLACFQGEVPSCRLEWEPARQAGFADGDVICRVSFSDGDWEHAMKLMISMQLWLADDLGYGGEFTAALRNWHNYLVRWALPRIFIVAEGSPPPIAIGL